jgi:phosphatidylserine/phosphatidylglycerophosphate/cardiolipin synthase-like enzyme
VTRWLEVFPKAKRSPATYLIDGEETFASIAAAVKTATKSGHYVYVLGWMLDVDFQLQAGDSATTFYSLLSDATKKGAEVRVLIWDNPIPGYHKLLDDVLPRLNKLPNTRAYLDDATFSPTQARALLHKIAPAVVDLVNRSNRMWGRDEIRSFAQRHDVPLDYVLYLLVNLLLVQNVGAHHEKVVVVKGSDGLVAYCGGLDINRNRVLTTVAGRPERFPGMHDAAVRVEGAAAHDVLQRFKRRWANHPRASKDALAGKDEPRPKQRDNGHPYVQVVGTFNSPDGTVKERSLSDAYFAIIEAAKEYIYIEDQYMVHMGVAKVLNRKIKEPNFRRLTFAIQQASETTDVLIPNRKRGEFFQLLVDGASKEEQEKVLLAVIEKDHWQQERHHPAMHAKTLIADDEIAIIGSANLNHRSFTLDSETSAVIFDDQARQSFARRFRIATWKHFLRKYQQPVVYEDWFIFPTKIRAYETTNDFSQLVKYTKDDAADVDLRIVEFIRDHQVAVAWALARTASLEETTFVLSEFEVKGIFDQLWDALLDPLAE